MADTLLQRVLDALAGGPLREFELLQAVSCDPKVLRPRLRDYALHDKVERGPLVPRVSSTGPFMVGTWRLPGDTRPARVASIQIPPPRKPKPVAIAVPAPALAPRQAARSVFDITPAHRYEQPAPVESFTEQWKRLRGEAAS